MVQKPKIMNCSKASASAKDLRKFKNVNIHLLKKYKYAPLFPVILDNYVKLEIRGTNC